MGSFGLGDTQLAGSSSEGQRHLDFIGGKEAVRRADLALSTECKEPGNEAERKLAAIWRDVFGIDAVGITDDFFELGGNSFTATALAAEIEATFGTRFTPADIITLSTVAQQAEKLAKEQGTASKLPACLILGRAGGPKPPLFMVHGGKGFAFFAPVFLDIVGEERSVYLFQAPGLDGRMTPIDSIDENTTVEEIAKLYVEAVRAIQPSGPYHFAAMCAGSFIALEMCHQLEAAGETIGRLILLDPTPAPPREKPQIVKEKKKHAKRGSDSERGALPWGFFSWWKRGEAGAKQLDPEKMTRKKAELQRKKVEARVEQMNDITPDQHSYTAERMFKVSQQLRAALYKHTPRPYPGSGRLLVCSARADEVLGETAFWPTHLGSMQHKVLGSKHSDVFGENLAETARFVRESLD